VVVVWTGAEETLGPCVMGMCVAGRKIREIVNMTMSRVEAVAEVLWELKRAGKLGTYSEIATRAGFSAGANGRTMLTCLKHIRKDWPHLQWWRAVSDTKQVEKGGEQADLIAVAEYELSDIDGEEERLGFVDEEIFMSWTPAET